MNKMIRQIIHNNIFIYLNKISLRTNKAEKRNNNDLGTNTKIDLFVIFKIIFYLL